MRGSLRKNGRTGHADSGTHTGPESRPEHAEAGRMDVIPSKFSLSMLADQCATLAVPLLKPDVTLEKQVDDTLGFIFSDQDKIKQIVLNLLTSSFKFTPAGGTVICRLRLLDAGQQRDAALIDTRRAREAIGFSPRLIKPSPMRKNDLTRTNRNLPKKLRESVPIHPQPIPVDCVHHMLHICHFAG